MIIKKTESKPTIDLTGPEGNAYCLLAYAKQFAKQLGKTDEEIKAIKDDMRSKDYEHLVSVFDQHFGEYVILLRD